MQNNLTFKNQGCNWELNAILIDEKPYFEASKVAGCLGYKNTNEAIKQHCRGVAKHEVSENTGLGMRNIEKNFIPESDLYRLIMRSNLPSAEKFQTWICEEVLPDIRKHGVYITSKLLSDPKALIAILQNYQEEKEKNKKLQHEKAWISNKREATAMNTASQKAKENYKLKKELGRCKDYATILAVQRITKGNYSWRKLKEYCTIKELEILNVPEERYGTVKSYPAKAWKKVYSIDLEDFFD